MNVESCRWDDAERIWSSTMAEAVDPDVVKNPSMLSAEVSPRDPPTRFVTVMIITYQQGE